MNEPINPEEVYSPHTIVIDDKCRKCGGAMRRGIALEQTFVGTCTVSPGGNGKLVVCLKCQDCGWSVKK